MPPLVRTPHLQGPAKQQALGCAKQQALGCAIPHRGRGSLVSVVLFVMSLCEFTSGTVSFSLDLAQYDFTPKFCLSVFKVYNLYFHFLALVVRFINAQLLMSCSKRFAGPCSEVLGSRTFRFRHGGNQRTFTVKLRGRIRGWTG